MESPSRSRGDGGWGFHLRDGARYRLATSHPPLRVCFSYGSSRGGEADVWRADYAVLLHFRLQII
jgi:hypothetical protein